MITNLYESIAAGLKAVKPCKIYVEDIPQNMSLPSFLISIYDQNPSDGINGRKKNEVGFDVMYYPEKEQEADAIRECWEMGEHMNQAFHIQDFRMKNRNAEVTDKVLHYTFTVPYRIIVSVETDKMQEMFHNTELKEE